MRLLTTAVSGILVLAACGGGSAEAELSDTAATTTEAVAITEATTSTTVAATTTTAAATTTTEAIMLVVVSDEQLAAAAAIGDIAAGEDLYFESLDGIPDGASCSSCHSFDGSDPHAPTHLGISAVASGRVDGMSAADYLRESIVDPYAFKVEGGWRFPMPYQYPNVLSEDQIENLVAFLLTR